MEREPERGRQKELEREGEGEIKTVFSESRKGGEG